MADRYGVYIRFKGQRAAQRLKPDGYTTRRRVHAAMIETRQLAEDTAVECQEYLDEHHPGSKAWAAPF